MKKIYLLSFILLLSFGAYSQIQEPVKWAYAAKKTGNNEAVIFVKATIDKGWHIYSQNIAEGGPTKTELKFAASEDISLLGKPSEPRPIKKFEKYFGVNVAYFEKQVIFQQKIKLNKNNPVVKGTITFLACSNKECLPPEDIEFTVAVK
ncbi:hypothetical protein GCM10023149_01480 [Mucilaginibacter gynuensis]|uniref:Thiol:disulfide interchange protein DsbD N-terminal domain-containing protein n=1 Tax=Mucilaginibacter gynuensis TaxID=1302236 RepID=A0ABP8FNW6_9SPHI